MKIFSQIVLFLFLTFISLPTIVLLIDKNKDVSLCFNINEEEIHKQIKEIKAQLVYEFSIPINFKVLVAKKHIFYDKTNYFKSFTQKIFLPPPELI